MFASHCATLDVLLQGRRVQWWEAACRVLDSVQVDLRVFPVALEDPYRAAGFEDIDMLRRVILESRYVSFVRFDPFDCLPHFKADLAASACCLLQWIF